MMCLHIKPNNFTTENWLNRLLTNILGVEQWFLVWYMLFKVTSVSSTWSMFRATNPQQNYKNVCVCGGGGCIFLWLCSVSQNEKNEVKKKKKEPPWPHKSGMTGSTEKFSETGLFTLLLGHGKNTGIIVYTHHQRTILKEIAKFK